MSRGELEFQLEENNGVQIVHVSGPLDSVTHDQFREYVDPLIQKEGASVVLDCTNLTYVNSRGVALLTQLSRQAKQQFGFFGVTGFRPYILKGIERLGLGDLLTPYPSLENALETAMAS